MLVPFETNHHHESVARTHCNKASDYLLGPGLLYHEQHNSGIQTTTASTSRAVTDRSEQLNQSPSKKYQANARPVTSAASYLKSKNEFSAKKKHQDAVQQMLLQRGINLEQHSSQYAQFLIQGSSNNASPIKKTSSHGKNQYDSQIKMNTNSYSYTKDSQMQTVRKLTSGGNSQQQVNANSSILHSSKIYEDNNIEMVGVGRE